VALHAPLLSARRPSTATRRRVGAGRADRLLAATGAGTSRGFFMSAVRRPRVPTPPRRAHAGARRRSRRSPTYPSCRLPHQRARRSRRPRSTASASRLRLPIVVSALCSTRGGFFLVGPFCIRPELAPLRPVNHHAVRQATRRALDIFVRDALTWARGCTRTRSRRHTRPVRPTTTRHTPRGTVRVPSTLGRGRTLCEPVFATREAGPWAIERPSAQVADSTRRRP